MSNKIVFDKDAREKIMTGVDVMAKAVGSSLGPRGQNTAIARPNPYGDIYDRTILHDGVSIAKAVELEDEFENMGAQVLKEAAQKQVDICGDGTTAVIILAQAILKECMGIIATGVNPMSLRLGLEQGRDKLLKALEAEATPIKTLKEEIHIATISAEDPSLGELVGKTLHEVGSDGVVTVEESKSADTTVEHQSGMSLDQGFMHPLFMTNPEKMQATLENPYILVTDKDINALVDMSELLTELHNRGTGLVIISPNVGGEALPLLIQNKMSGQLSSLAIKAPAFGSIQKAILADIAILTGANYITDDAGHKLSDIKLSDLGHADYVTSTKSESLIVGGKGKKSDINSRIAQLKAQIAEELSEFELIKLRERLGKLTNGVSVIYVGGYTEIEMKERKERVDDAVHATRAAMKHGIVPGGEVILLKVRETLSQSLTDQILYRALEQPFNRLVTNAGQDAGQLREQLAQSQEGTKLFYGYDVTTLSLKDMVASGIVDPVMVPMKALENAVSVAIQLMSTGTVIVPIPKDTDKKKQ